MNSSRMIHSARCAVTTLSPLLTHRACLHYNAALRKLYEFEFYLESDCYPIRLCRAHPGCPCTDVTYLSLLYYLAILDIHLSYYTSSINSRRCVLCNGMLYLVAAERRTPLCLRCVSFVTLCCTSPQSNDRAVTQKQWWVLYDASPSDTRLAGGVLCVRPGQTSG